MFKKIKSGWLMIILIVLLGVYFIVRYAGSDDRNFRDKVVEFDPETITEILIKAPEEPEPTHLKLIGNEWKVMINDKAYQADTNTIVSMLGQLSQMATKRFAGKGKDQWQKYELTDTMGLFIDLRKGNKEIASLVIGKFEYTQPQQQRQQPAGMRQPQGEMSTYVRLADEPEVYVVDGFLRMGIGRSSDAYRDKNMVKVNRDDITRIVFDYPDQQMELLNVEGKYQINGMPADSAKTTKYLRIISLMTGQEYVSEDLQLGPASHTLLLEGNNFSPVEIKAFPVADTNIRHVLYSSRIPDAYFNGSKAGLFDKVMVDQSAFLPDPSDE